MRDRPGIKLDAILHLFGTPTYEGVDAEAKAHIGALIICEIAENIDALIKGLSSEK